MRHGKKFNHLSRTDSHRKALLSSLATSLIVHKRITTTVAKAKALRVYVEPLLTKSKLDSTHSRRMVFSYLQDKNSVNILFRDVASKIAERPGGYTRIIKTGTRLGDNAEMCFIELVDYNEIYTAKTEVKKAKTTRRGRSSGAVAKPKTETASMETIKTEDFTPTQKLVETTLPIAEVETPALSSDSALVETESPSVHSIETKDKSDDQEKDKEENLDKESEK